MNSEPEEKPHTAAVVSFKYVAGTCRKPNQSQANRRAAWTSHKQNRKSSRVVHSLSMGRHCIFFRVMEKNRNRYRRNLDSFIENDAKVSSFDSFKFDCLDFQSKFF